MNKYFWIGIASILSVGPILLLLNQIVGPECAIKVWADGHYSAPIGTQCETMKLVPRDEACYSRLQLEAMGLTTTAVSE